MADALFLALAVLTIGSAIAALELRSLIYGSIALMGTLGGIAGFFILLPRGVFPRIRIDMLLHIGWYKLIGLSFVNIFIALGLLYAGILGPEGIF